MKLSVTIYENDVTNMTMSDNDYKRKPTKRQIAIVMSVLRDFRFFPKKEEIPNFRSVAHLHRYRQEMIKHALKNYSDRDIYYYLEQRRIEAEKQAQAEEVGA